MYNIHVGCVLIAGEPEDSVADAPNVAYFLVNSSSSDSSNCCIWRYFGSHNCWNNCNGGNNVTVMVKVHPSAVWKFAIFVDPLMTTIPTEIQFRSN